ncbi:MAG: shikimate dehydrogenase [Bacteroidota bacterium]|nr:shikimate dehydrogenase [Bacteroidota bacterium]
MQKKIYGLIGWPLEHSFSPQYFTEKFKQLNLSGHSYKLFPLNNILQFPELIMRRSDLQGLNVTIPYKEDIINYLDEMDREAAVVGAVNCVRFRQTKGDLLLKGYNTDIYGFEKSLQDKLDLSKVKHAIILGNGGAAKAAKYVLDKNKIQYHIVSRSIQDDENNIITYNQLSDEYIGIIDLLINATPVGMWPKTDEAPAINYAALSSKCLCYDMVYNPEETLYLQRCKEVGCDTQNGVDMLKHQADKSWEIWNL